MVSNPRVKISQGLYRHYRDVYWQRDGKGTTISHVVLMYLFRNDLKSSTYALYCYYYCFVFWEVHPAKMFQNSFWHIIWLTYLTKTHGLPVRFSDAFMMLNDFPRSNHHHDRFGDVSRSFDTPTHTPASCRHVSINQVGAKTVCQEMRKSKWKNGYSTTNVMFHCGPCWRGAIFGNIAAGQFLAP